MVTEKPKIKVRNIRERAVPFSEGKLCRIKYWEWEGREANGSDVFIDTLFPNWENFGGREAFSILFPANLWHGRPGSGVSEELENSEEWNFLLDNVFYCAIVRKQVFLCSKLNFHEANF
jgi:hypothetical protein